MPNSQARLSRPAMSLKRLDACQACAKVSAVRSSAAISEPVCLSSHARIQTA